MIRSKNDELANQIYRSDKHSSMIFYDINIELIQNSGTNKIVDYRITFRITKDIFTYSIPLFISAKSKENIRSYRKVHYNCALENELRYDNNGETFKWNSGNNFSDELQWDDKYVKFKIYTSNNTYTIQTYDIHPTFELCMLKWRRVETICDIENITDREDIYNNLVEDDSYLNIILLNEIREYDLVYEFWESYIPNVKVPEHQDMIMNYLINCNSLYADMVVDATLDNFKKYMMLLYQKYSDKYEIRKIREQLRSDFNNHQRNPKYDPSRYLTTDLEMIKEKLDFLYTCPVKDKDY